MVQRPQGKYDKARYAAVRALVRVHRGGWANFAYGSALAGAALDERDKAFAGAVFYGAAERLVTLDFLLAPFLKKDIEKLDVELRAILECGAYQLLYMRVPPSAAVDESVRLARAFGKTSAAGLVNAVLRRVAREVPRLGLAPAVDAGTGASTAGKPASAGPGAEASASGPDLSGHAFADEAERVQVTFSVSAAVATAVMEALPGEYDAFLSACFSNGWTCLRVNTLKNSREELARYFAGKQVESRPGFLPEALYARLPGGPAGEPGFAEGRYHVQGEASQVACACLGARPGEQVLDLCAAPGGKTATLAQGMGGGAGLVACELRENRLPLIGQTLERLGIAGALVLPGDGTVYNPDLAGQHRVLCDVPCSGLGVLAQKPDLRLADGANFAALPALQMKLLSNASRYVKQGGRLVYSTCTVRPAENEAVVREFLAEHGGFHPAAPPVAPEGAVITDGMMTLLPHRTGLDGFFVAVLEKD